MTGPRRMWIGAAVAVVAITTALVVRNQVRVAANREMRRAEALRKAETRKTLFAELRPVHVSNCELQRFGELHDGGYPLCANLLGSAKAGYSYGISGYDGWGCDVSRQLHVPVHQYDCFDLRAPVCDGGTTMFHGECVGTATSTADGRPFDTLAGQLARNGDADTPVVMKIDVEGAEWDSLRLAPDTLFAHIDQLDIEFHHVDEAKYIETVRRLKQFFYVAHVHYNNFSCDASLRPFPSWAFEVLLVNRRIAVTDGSPAPAARAGVDAANDPTAPDCQAAS